MTRALLSAACHAYAVAGVAYLVHLLRMKGRASLLGGIALAVGLVLHTAAIVLRVREQVQSPFSGVGDGLSALAALLVFAYLALDRIYRLPALGAFVTPLALTVTVSALLLPQGPVATTSGLAVPGLYAHVLLAFAAFALFALASGAAVLYLVLERPTPASSASPGRRPAGGRPAPPGRRRGSPGRRRSCRPTRSARTTRSDDRARQ